MEPCETRLVISIKSDLRASTKAWCCVRGITVTESLGKDTNKGAQCCFSVQGID